MDAIKFISYQLQHPGQVTLTWKHSENLTGVFKETRLYVKFDEAITLDADIAQYMFFSVVIPCYATIHRQPFVVDFPFKTDKRIAETILRYFNFSQVKVHIGTSDGPSFQHGGNNCRTHALFYGGGKDSSLSAAIHADLYGAEKTTLFRLVWDSDIANLSKKREIISDHLSFLQKRGFEVQFVESNFHCVIENRDVGKSANFALYPGLMAPALAAGKYIQAAHGYDGSEFHLGTNPSQRARFALVRPEFISAYANATSLTLKRNFAVRNFNYGLGPNPAFKLLSAAYPEYYSNIYMCERLGGKWCLKCRKCFTYALASLANQKECDFNLGYYFENSQYVRELVTDVESGFADSPTQFPPQVDKFAHRNHTCAIIQLSRQIDPSYAREKLWHKKYRNAFLNLVRIIEPFRYFDYPEHSKFWLRAFEEDQHFAEISIEEQQREKTILLERCSAAQVPINSDYELSGVNVSKIVKYRYINRYER